MIVVLSMTHDCKTQITLESMRFLSPVLQSWSLTFRVTSHMRLRARDHWLQALSLVEKAAPVPSIRLTDQRSKGTQDGYKVYMGFLHGIKWIMFGGHLDFFFQKPPLEGRPDTKSGDHGTPESHNSWFIIFYWVWGPHMNRNSLKWHLIEGPVTYDFPWHLRARAHITWFRKCLRTTCGHFSWGLTILWSRLLAYVKSGP
jgi:hypothetical protein